MTQSGSRTRGSRRGPVEDRRLVRLELEASAILLQVVGRDLVAHLLEAMGAKGSVVPLACR